MVLLIRSAMRWVVSCPALFSRVALLVRRVRITPTKSARIRTIPAMTSVRSSHFGIRYKSPIMPGCTTRYTSSMTAAAAAALRKNGLPFGAAAKVPRLTPRTNWSVTHRTRM